jgi:hypothetical protein
MYHIRQGCHNTMVPCFICTTLSALRGFKHKSPLIIMHERPNLKMFVPYCEHSTIKPMGENLLRCIIQNAKDLVFNKKNISLIFWSQQY